jgi:hypothetical protein
MGTEDLGSGLVNDLVDFRFAERQKLLRAEADGGETLAKERTADLAHKPGLVFRRKFLGLQDQIINR